jgi:hypothetical protein
VVASVGSVDRLYASEGGMGYAHPNVRLLVRKGGLRSRRSQLDSGNDCTSFAEIYKSKELKRRNAMKRSKLLPILLLMLTSLALAQSAPSGQQSSMPNHLSSM